MHYLKQHPQLCQCCCALQELPTLKATDHQAADLLQHAINGLLYASPRSLVITLQHFCRVQDAVAARRQQHGSNGSDGGCGSSGGNGSEGSSGSNGGGCLPMQAASWPLGVTVDGREKGQPDLSTLQGVMEVRGTLHTRSTDVSSHSNHPMVAAAAAAAPCKE
jgi:hypothetical protein